MTQVRGRKGFRASAMTPAARAVFDVLSDGQWHSRASLMDAAAPLVPVAQAARFGARRDQRRNVPREDPHGQQLLIRNSREIVAQSLRGALTRGRVEQDGDLYRIVPEAAEALRAVDDRPAAAGLPSAAVRAGRDALRARAEDPDLPPVNLSTPAGCAVAAEQVLLGLAAAGWRVVRD